MRRLLFKLFRRRRLELDLEAELAFHEEMAAANDNPIRLGNRSRIKEQARDVWRWRTVESAWRDVVHAARRLRQTPAFTLATVLAAAAFALTFRRVRALLAVLPPLVLGTVWTAGFATIFPGGLSAIAVAFMSVVIGVGVDTGVHVYAALLEARRDGLSPRDAARVARNKTMRPVLNSLAIENITITRQDELAFILDRSIKQAIATQAPVTFILSPLLTGGKAFEA